MATRPLPSWFVSESAAVTTIPRDSAARTTACASGCGERFSALAAHDSSSRSETSVTATTSVTSKRPCVIVPVLSSATSRTRPSASRNAPPLNRMPLRAAFAIADRIVAGVAMTSAHGEATTSSVIARYSDERHSLPNTSGGSSSMSVAANMTTTV